jgi:lysophospholipase L1-like esterase
VSKKFFLFSIVSIEILFGSGFLYKYYQNKVLENKVLGVETIAVIDKSKTVFVENEEAQYYWEFIPNGIEEDDQSWLPHKVTYNINGDGLNDLYDYSIEKKSNTYRIITLGDSFTYGHFVNTQDNWTEQLEDLLNKDTLGCQYDNFEVINLGMPGFDVQYIVQRYKEIGQKYNPDLILWFESGSGFYRLNEFMQPIIEECLGTEVAQKKNSYRPCWDKAGDMINEKYSIWDRSEVTKKYYDVFSSLDNTEKTSMIYYNSLSNDEKEIIDMWRNRYKNISFLPLVPRPSQEEKLLDGHPNAEGHKSMAQHFFKYLVEEKNICEK